MFPDKAGAQAYDNMQTSQMIGALKWIALQHSVQVVEQPAGDKKPIRAQLRGRGIKQRGSGVHARDAELHLLGFILKNNLDQKLEGKHG